MKHLLIISLLSITFSQELKVEGNLNVTGAVINDSLAQVIAVQKTEIDSLQTQINSLYNDVIYQLEEQLAAMKRSLSRLCNAKPDAGLCLKKGSGVYYNSSSGKCELFTYGGCFGFVPFGSLEECENICE